MTGDPGATGAPPIPEATCPSCGAPVDAGDSFCVSFGKLVV